MASNNPGQLKIQQLGPVPTVDDGSVLTNPPPTLGSDDVFPDQLIEGSAQFVWKSIPLNTAQFQGVSGRWNLKLDTMFSFNGTGLTAQILDPLSGQQIDIANIPVDLTDGGLEDDGGGLIKVKIAAGALTLGAAGLNVQDATGAQKGVVQIDTTHGLDVSSGILEVDLDNETSVATVEGAALRFRTSDGALGIKAATYLAIDSAIAGATAKQTVPSSVQIDGTDGASSIGLRLNNHIIADVLDPTADQHAATKGYVDSQVSAVGNPLDPTDAMMDGNETNISALAIGDRVVALAANIHSATNALGDILTVVTAGQLSDATVFDPGNNDQAYCFDDTYAGGPGAPNGAGTYKHNSATGVWSLLAPAPTFNAAVDAVPGPGVLGGIIPSTGVTADGSGNLTLKLSDANNTPVDSGLRTVADTGFGNAGLAVKVDGTSDTIDVVTGGIRVKPGSIGTTELAAGGVTADDISFAGVSGLIETGGLGIDINNPSAGSQVAGDSGLALDANGIFVPAKAIDARFIDFDTQTMETGAANVLQVNVDGTTIQRAAGGIRILANGVGSNELDMGDGLEDNGSGAVRVHINTSIFQFSTGELDVQTNGITSAHVNYGNGLNASGSQLVVQANGPSLQVGPSGVSISDGGVTFAKLNTDANSALRDSGSGIIDVDVDEETIENNSGTLRIKEFFRKKLTWATQDASNPIPAAGGSGTDVTYDFIMVGAGEHTQSPAGAVGFDSASVEVFINGIPVGVNALTITATTVTVRTDPTGAQTANRVPYALEVSSATHGDCVDIVANFN